MHLLIHTRRSHKTRTTQHQIVFTPWPLGRMFQSRGFTIFTQLRTIHILHSTHTENPFFFLLKNMTRFRAGNGMLCRVILIIYARSELWRINGGKQIHGRVMCSCFLNTAECCVSKQTSREMFTFMLSQEIFCHFSANRWWPVENVYLFSVTQKNAHTDCVFVP